MGLLTAISCGVIATQFTFNATCDNMLHMDTLVASSERHSTVNGQKTGEEAQEPQGPESL